MVENKYSELPVVPFKKTSVPAADVVAFIKALPYAAAIKRTVYAIVYNETGNFKSFVNTNGAGIQADNARWAKRWDSTLVGTTVTPENMTGNPRRFLVFKTWQDSVTMLAWYVNDRGMYIGGNSSGWANIKKVGDARLVNGQLLQVDLYTVYYRAWVTGEEDAKPKLPDIKDFTAIYNKSATLF